MYPHAMSESARRMLRTVALSVAAAALGWLPARAQQAVSGQGGANPPASANKSTEQADAHILDGSDVPTVLLVPAHSDAAAARRKDPDAILAMYTESLFKNSGKFQVLRYSADLPSIRRAVREHTIAVSDLAAPVPQATIQRIARAVGAQYIFAYSTVVDREGMKTDARFEDSVSQQAWRTVWAEQLDVAAVVERRRLKVTDMAALTTDTIGERTGIPSHLAAGLHMRPSKVIHIAGSGAPAKKAIGADQPTPSAAADASTSGQTPPSDGETPATPQSPGRGAATAHTVRPQEPTGMASQTSPNGLPAQPPGVDGLPAAVTLAPDAAPAPQVRPDDIVMAAHYHDSGDLANEVLALRRAINAHPFDAGLRRRLVEAYEARHMLDAALDEANRTVTLSPTNGEVQRLKGDCLLARGDTTGARAAYQEAVRLDPNDTTARVALGDALAADGQYAEAVDAYLAAAKADPRSALPHRRLARVMTQRASGDAAQYTASLAEIARARALTPVSDTDTYHDDYIVLMRLLESRLRDILDEVQNNVAANDQGKRSAVELMRAVEDMKERTQALAGYLDKLPPAVGEDVTHAHYQQTAALTAQTISLLHDFLASGDTRTEGALRSTGLDALRELAVASKRLGAKRAETAASGAS